MTNELTTEVEDKTVGENGMALCSLKELTYFNGDEDLREALEMCDEEMDMGDLIRVSTPAGGSTSWVIETISGEETVKDITGILVYVQKAGVLWPTFEPSEGTRPVLRTFDLKTATLGCEMDDIPSEMIDILYRKDKNTGKYIYLLNAAEVENGEAEPLFDWENLPYNKFGSGKNGIGKRCVEQRMVFILRDGDIQPLLIRIQPGSLQDFRRFMKQIPLVARVPFYRCKVSLTLSQDMSQGGIKFSKIVPKIVSCLNKEDGEVIKKTFTKPLSDGLAQRYADEDTQAADDGYSKSE